MATRADLRTRARVRADQDNSTFPTDTQYNLFIDEAAKEVWYDLIRAGWPPSFSAATLALPAVPSTAGVVTLSTDAGVSVAVAFVRGVFCQVGGTWYELKRLNEGDRADLYSVTGTQPTHYDVRVSADDGIQVEFLPYVAGVQVRIEYVKEHPGFASDVVQWKGPARSDELIVLRAAQKGMRKEGNDQGAAMVDREYQYLQQCVADLASWTNMRHAATIRDVGNPLGPSRLPGDYDVYGPDR